jgi:PAS domain-containing protein
MTSQTLNQIQARWSTFWNRLTEPDAALENPLEREQARLLSSTLWVFLLTTCALFVGRLGTHGLHADFDLNARIAIIVFSFVASIFSHRGHIRLLSLISALFGSLIVFYVFLFERDLAGLSTLNYLIVVIIFGSLFLPLWLNTLIFAIQLVGILTCAWLLSNIAFAEFLSGPLSFHLTLGVIALSITHYRNSLENTRKTAITLSEKRFRGIFETSPIGIKLYGANGEFQGANPTCLNNFGFLQSSSTFHLNLFVDPLVSAEAKERLCNGERLRFENKFDPKKAKLRFPCLRRNPLSGCQHYAFAGEWRGTGLSDAVG